MARNDQGHKRALPRRANPMHTTGNMVIERKYSWENRRLSPLWFAWRGGLGDRKRMDTFAAVSQNKWADRAASLLGTRFQKPVDLADAQDDNTMMEALDALLSTYGLRLVLLVVLLDRGGGPIPA